MSSVLSFFLSLILLSGSAFASRETPAQALREMTEIAFHHGKKAAFVFDLDETLVDSTPRRFASLKDAIFELCQIRHRDCGPLSRIKIGNLYRSPNRYDDTSFLLLSGAKDTSFVAQITARALEIYLSGAYIVEKDRLYGGAARFVQTLKSSGASVYFVTSRSIERQSRATLRFLFNEGLLKKGEERFLYLKPDSEKSVDFKRRATLEIAKRVHRKGGEIDGIFENEPENLNVWIESFPRARPFFVLGAMTHEAPIPRQATILENYAY